ncbi:MAG TPA: 7-carboxy-7-deazaguanine synthase [bacterium]|jgi:7-carboxy-7-deazaguanine synthase (Cx14CxxC type)
MYTVKEIYFTRQGEGYYTGRESVFLRFAGCNLWSGHEKDRQDAVCKFCDTKFVGTDGPGGGRYQSADDIISKSDELWIKNSKNVSRRFVVITGGEPMLQVDADLVEAFHSKGYKIAIESNGTIPVLDSIDWITISPKEGAVLVQKSGSELKYVYPQGDSDPRRYESLKFEHFYIQPMDGPDLERNTELSVKFCDDNPGWNLSLQTHKLLGIP